MVFYNFVTLIALISVCNSQPYDSSQIAKIDDEQLSLIFGHSDYSVVAREQLSFELKRAQLEKLKTAEKLAAEKKEDSVSDKSTENVFKQARENRKILNSITAQLLSMEAQKEERKVVEPLKSKSAEAISKIIQDLETLLKKAPLRQKAKLRKALKNLMKKKENKEEEISAAATPTENIAELNDRKNSEKSSVKMLSAVKIIQDYLRNLLKADQKGNLREALKRLRNGRKNTDEEKSSAEKPAENIIEPNKKTDASSGAKIVEDLKNLLEASKKGNFQEALNYVRKEKGNTNEERSSAETLFSVTKNQPGQEAKETDKVIQNLEKLLSEAPEILKSGLQEALRNAKKEQEIKIKEKIVSEAPPETDFSGTIQDLEKLLKKAPEILKPDLGEALKNLRREQEEIKNKKSEVETPNEGTAEREEKKSDVSKAIQDLEKLLKEAPAVLKPDLQEALKILKEEENRNKEMETITPNEETKIGIEKKTDRLKAIQDLEKLLREAPSILKPDLQEALKNLKEEKNKNREIGSEKSDEKDNNEENNAETSGTNTPSTKFTENGAEKEVDISQVIHDLEKLLKEAPESLKGDLQEALRNLRKEDDVQDSLSHPGNPAANEIISEASKETARISDINCQSNPCENGGNCTDEENSYSCACPIGFAGLDCERVMTTRIAIKNECPAKISVALKNGTFESANGWFVKEAGGVITHFIQRFSEQVVYVHVTVLNENLSWDGWEEAAELQVSCVCNNKGPWISDDCDQGVQTGGSCSSVKFFPVMVSEEEVIKTINCDFARCRSNPCQNGGICSDRKKGYRCTCVSGFGGVNCEKRLKTKLILQNKCLAHLFVALHYSTFNSQLVTNGWFQSEKGIDVIRNVDRYRFPEQLVYVHVDIHNKKLSWDGWEEAGEPRHYCVCSNLVGPWTFDDCKRAQSGENCYQGIFYPLKVFGEEFTRNITCHTDECQSDPCLNNGTCISGNGGYNCTCSDGYTGLNCEIDRDECQSNPCLNHGICTIENNGYNCMCSVGYTGLNCEIDKDECQSNPCLRNGKCIDGIGGYNCTCSDGYTGLNCEIDKDECQSNPCLNNGTCIDGSNSYSCTCSDGYAGLNCVIDTDECQSNPCLNHGTCIDGNNGYSCTCPIGYTGVNCEINTDECQSNPCLNNGSCIDGSNSYSCTCSDGYTGFNCEIDTDECQSNPCLNNGTCIDGNNGYRCTCPVGYTGVNCEINTDECQSNPCLNDGSCIDGSNGYTCTCSEGYAGLNCEIDTDECQSNPCLSNGKCIDGSNGYTCTCLDGYTGANCEIDIDECESNPCLNHGTCNNGINDYNCTCLDGYTGLNCQIKVRVKKLDDKR